MNSAIKITFPVAFGYFPLGITFGVLFSQLGYHWVYGAVMALVVYAGAAQFLAISFIAAHADIATIFTATMLLNLRHIFYGIPMAPKYRSLPLPSQIFSIFALTDEAYAINVALREGENEHQLAFFVSLLNLLYWFLFCTIGLWLGQVVSYIPGGLEFSLVALFAVLLTERIITDKSLLQIIIGVFSSALAFLIVGKTNFIVVALSIGCISSVLFRRQLGSI